MKKILFLLSLLVPFALLAQNRHVGPYSSDVGGINYIHQIPVTKQYYAAQGLVGSGTTVTNYPATAMDSTSFAFTTTNYFGAGGTKYGGFMYASLGTDSVLVTAPYSILIGSSFDEGHLSRHSRIHPGGVPVFQWNYPDSTGQLSWALDSLTYMRWYNHGIGGQTSSQVRARWARDVLGQVINGLIDGRGNQTLLRTHPYAAFYDGVGNDWTIGGMTPQITINNLIYFAESCQENGIKFICVISVTGAGPSVVGDAYVQTVNKFLEGGGLNKYGAVVVNLRDYWSDPAWGRNIGLSQDGIHGNPNLVNSTDFTHFTELGYDSVASWLVRTARIPKVTSVVIASALAPVNPVANFNYPSALTIDGQAYTTAKAIDTILLTRPLGRDPRFVYESGDSVWIKATAVSPIGTVTGTKWGIGYMAWVLDNTGPGYDTTSVFTRNMAGGSMGTNLNISSIVIQPENGASTNPYLYIYNAGLTADILSVNPASTNWLGVNMQGVPRIASEALSVVGDINTHTHSVVSLGQGSEFGNLQVGFVNTASAFGVGLGTNGTGDVLSSLGSAIMAGPRLALNSFSTRTPPVSSSALNFGEINDSTGIGLMTGIGDTIPELRSMFPINDTVTSKAPNIIGGLSLEYNIINSGVDRVMGYRNQLGDNAFNYLGGRAAFGGWTPDPAAQVDIQSTTKGFLPPRMTTTQRNAIGGVSVTITGGGTGYSVIPKVVVTGGGGTGARFYAAVSGGALTAITPVGSDAGSGYGASLPTITLANTSGSGATWTVNHAAIPAGLVIYNTDSTQNPLEMYDGSAWHGLLTSNNGGGGSTSSTLFAQTANGSAVTSTSPTSLLGTGVGSLTVAANTMYVGQTFVLHGYFTYSSAASPAGLTWNPLIGGTGWNPGGPTMPISQTNASGEFTFTYTVLTLGSTGTVQSNSVITYAGVSPSVVNNTSTNTINTTSSVAFGLNISWASTVTGDTMNSIPSVTLKTY